MDGRSSHAAVCRAVPPPARSWRQARCRAATRETPRRRRASSTRSPTLPCVPVRTRQSTLRSVTRSTVRPPNWYGARYRNSSKRCSTSMTRMSVGRETTTAGAEPSAELKLPGLFGTLASGTAASRRHFEGSRAETVAAQTRGHDAPILARAARVSKGGEGLLSSLRKDAADADVGAPAAVEARRARQDHRSNQRVQDHAGADVGPQRGASQCRRRRRSRARRPRRSAPPMKSGSRPSCRR